MRVSPHPSIFGFLFIDSLRSSLGDQGIGGGGLVSPGGGKGLGLSVVAGNSVNTALHEDELVLLVLVLPELLEVLAHNHSLLDEVVEVLGDVGGETVGLQDAEHVLSSHCLDTGNAMGITEDNTNLRWGQTLLGELADMVDNLLRRGLQPRGGSPLVGEDGRGDTLSNTMHATHDCKLCMASKHFIANWTAT